MAFDYRKIIDNAVVYEGEIENPIVSVCIITYNKEQFIRDALNSVFMQKTQYSYEIVIGDNDSKDRTKNILLDYYEKFRDKITLIFNNDNMELTNNIYRTMCCCRGKYITILYGDDYWIVPNKLEMQVNFLENYPEFVGVSSIIESRYNGLDECVIRYPEKKYYDSKIDITDYLKGNNFPMAALMFKNFFKYQKGREYFSSMLSASKYIDDLSFCTLLLNKGNIYILPVCMCVYRIFKPNEKQNNFNSVNKRVHKFEKHIMLLNFLDELFRGDLDFSFRYAEYMGSGLKSVILDKQLSHFLRIYKTIPIKYRKLSSNVILLSFTRKIKRLIKK